MNSAWHLQKKLSDFTGKHLYWSLILMKLQAGGTSNFINKEAAIELFSCEFCKIFKNTYFDEHLLLHLKCYISVKNTAEAIPEYSKTAATARGINIV